jgi:hypothetical protein
MTVFYISPTGSGSRNGSTVGNAGTIYDLPNIIAAAGPGDEVRLLADQGAYQVTRPISIDAGGAAGAPVLVCGTDSNGNPMAATIEGTRAPDWSRGRAQGAELFRLMSGANHLAFSDLATSHLGNGVFRIGADVENLAIRRVAAANVTRFIETQRSGDATSASVNGLTVENVTVSGFSQSAIRLKYNGRNVVLRDIVGDGMGVNGELVMAGVSLAGTVHDVLLERVTMKNVQGRGGPTQYWNGDGFAAERGTYNLTFRDTMAVSNTDAGYDIKSTNAQFIRATSSGNNKNYRFWGEQVTVTDSISRDPHHFGGSGKSSHFHGAGNTGAEVTLDNFRYSDPSGMGRVFDLSNGKADIKPVDTPMPDKSRILFGVGSTLRVVNGGEGGGPVTNPDPTPNPDPAPIPNPNPKPQNVVGTSGADQLNGGTGADVMTGGKGHDTYLVNHVGDRVTEDRKAGVDHVRTSLNAYTLGVDVENLSFIGSGNFAGTGSRRDNTITGGAGNDRLDGRGGNDVLIGGEGADTYVFNRGGKEDVIHSRDSGAADMLVFGPGITEDQLWFGKSGNDLLVSVLGNGGSDGVRVKGWYSDPPPGSPSSSSTTALPSKRPGCSSWSRRWPISRQSPGRPSASWATSSRRWTRSSPRTGRVPDDNPAGLASMARPAASLFDAALAAARRVDDTVKPASRPTLFSAKVEKSRLVVGEENYPDTLGTSSVAAAPARWWAADAMTQWLSNKGRYVHLESM